MSLPALRYVGGLTGLPPTAKLLLYELANVHNAETGQCNPSAESLAAASGLAAPQVRTIARQLCHAGLIRREGRNFTFAAMEPPAALQPVPANWWPTEAAVQALIDAYPHHHFSMEDAVNDFIQWANRRGGIAGDRDRAFQSAIGGILARRQPGQVAIRRDDGRTEPASALSLLAGRR